MEAYIAKRRKKSSKNKILIVIIFMFIIASGIILYKFYEKIDINEKNYILDEGDSLYFKSTQKHKFVNPTDRMTRVLWVVTPPTF